MVGKNVNGTLQNTITALLTDRPIAYHPVIAKAVKSVTAGVFLSQFLYWTPRTKDPDGWIYKTQADIYEETALTRREQETARRILMDKGVLEEKKKGVPCRLYFRVNMAALVNLLGEEADLPHPQDGGNRHPGMAENDSPECPKAPDKDGQTQQTINKNTENTIQETTTENEPGIPKPIDHTCSTTWHLALEKLKEDLPLGETEARLNGTILLQLTDTVARIGVPTPNALLWLERRLYRHIGKAIQGVLGREVDLQFVVASCAG
jgi:hypothetical protein